MRYRLPPDDLPGALPLPWFANGETGAASFGFSFFGFFASRLPRCSPLAMAYLRCRSDPRRDGIAVVGRIVQRMLWA
jgi:hypothetical protein